ncbi:MAG: 5'-deoxynucleotidase [Clostridia bacterium]
MGYNFFAYLSRMKYIERWSLMRSTERENIMEHSAQVAQLAHALAVINNRVFGGNASPDRAAALAVFHDASEVITGDLPTPIKYYNSRINDAYKELETVASDKLISMLPQELKSDYSAILNQDANSPEYAFVKAADKLAAYIKCIEEIKSGNKEFVKAHKATQAAVEESELKEVKYFADNFLQGFALTLDELD